MAEPTPTHNDCVRIFLFLKRKEGTTREQFRNYWRDVHAKLFVSLNIVKTNILRYERTVADDKWISFPETTMGIKAPDWDGVLILDGESFDKIFEVFTSEEYQRVVAPDEANFVNRAECQLLPVGVITTIA
ncbi:hypothetical protein C0995_008668 [Termitomyces sp. Mi166|nr:hypothetical protein C0995_008668 [Termitomyces sp. Mi166\